MDIAEIIRAKREVESPRRRRRARPRQRKVRASGAAASDMVTLTRQLRGLNRDLSKSIAEHLFPLLRRLDGEGIADSADWQDDFVDEIELALDRIRFEHITLGETRAQFIGQQAVTRTDKRNRERFYKSIEEVMGIDLQSIVDESGLEPILKLKTRENVNLIKSIPKNHFEKIQTLVLETVVQGRKDGKSLIEELREIGKVSDRRAKFIARDQTAKLTAALNRERNEALGIKEYIWRTSRDERVRESHRSKNGKKFRWDKPPAGTGHPGEDFQCRCTAQPVVEL